MADLKALVEREMERAGEPAFAFEDLDGLRVRRHRTRRITAAVVGLGLVLIGSLVGASLYRSARVPATPPEEPRVDLGIFAPVAGRIVYYTDSSLWAVDPNAPSPDSTLVRLDLGRTADADRFASFTVPLGWSSDGTKLLFLREDPTDDTFPYDRHLYILHADGTETQVTPEPVGDAAISPDGSRVVLAADGGGLYVVDAEGGQPVRMADEGESPTFSPDGTQIAYLGLERSARGVTMGREHVWVANADGTDAREILVEEPALEKGVFELEWSPVGDRIAMENTLEGHVAISTFAPDGSDFTEVITGGFKPYWSPDGAQIAFRVPGRDGLSIAEADGSNVRTLDFGTSGPWHPGATAAPDGEDTPAAFLAADEVLWLDSSNGDDLLAVGAVTGEARILVEDIRAFRGAMRSADGRWVAYERWSGTSPSLWVVGPELEPRKVIDLPDEGVLGAWAWSSTGARLAADWRSRLHVIDPATGLVTDLASMAGVDSPPAWSPDGTRIVLGVTDGSIDVVDVRTGERSVLAELPGDDLDSIDALAWSPDGSRLAVFSDVEPGTGRLFVLNADGSDIRVVAEEELVIHLDWSPDGSRIVFAADAVEAPRIDIWVAHADGTPASLVASPEYSGYQGWGSPVWSPDGSQIGYSVQPNQAFVIDADGAGDAVPIDDLTYASWNGGSFCWSCLWWINHPVTYTSPGGAS
jgi:Tol biopolymer transport system component